jgi:hypothetical protein
MIFRQRTHRLAVMYISGRWKVLDENLKKTTNHRMSFERRMIKNLSQRQVLLGSALGRTCLCFLTKIPIGRELLKTRDLLENSCNGLPGAICQIYAFDFNVCERMRLPFDETL